MILNAAQVEATPLLLPAISTPISPEDQVTYSIGVNILSCKEVCRKCCSKTGVLLPTSVLSFVSYKAKISLLAYTILNIYPGLFCSLGMYYYGGRIGAWTGSFVDCCCLKMETCCEEDEPIHNT